MPSERELSSPGLWECDGTGWSKGGCLRNLVGRDGSRVGVLGMWWEGMEQGWVFYSSVANLSFLGLFP